MRRFSLTLLAGGVLAVVTVSGADAQEIPVQATAEIGRTVQEGIAREFTTCKLQDGLWGGYDVRVHVTMGIDGLPHLFELREGRFSRVVDPEPMPGPNRFERSGRVFVGTADEAFQKGLPFFVSAAEVSPPNRLMVTIVSNPQISVGLATLLAVIDQPGVEDLVSITIPVESRAEAQRLVAVNEALRNPGLVRLAVLRDVGQTALMIGCVLSNELDVRPAL